MSTTNIRMPVVALLSTALSLHAAGVIRGTVVDATSGAALPGVNVMAMRSIAEMNVARTIPYRAITDDKGAYTLNGVQDGNYEICATAFAGYLDLCSWASPVPVRVASSTAEAGIAMQRGVPLLIAFADPNGLLEQLRSKIPSGPITVEVTGQDGKRRLIPSDSRDAGGFRTIVPQDIPLAITISTTALSLADSSGRTINAASGYQTIARVPPPTVSPVPLMFNAGRRTTDFRLVFRIVGLTAEGERAVSR